MLKTILSNRSERVGRLSVLLLASLFGAVLPACQNKELHFGAEPQAEALVKRASLLPAGEPSVKPSRRDRAPAPPKEIATDKSAKPKPPQAPKSTPAPPPVEEPSIKLGASLDLKRVVITHEIEGREPVAAGGALRSDRPVIAFLELGSGAGETHEIQVIFEHESGKRVGFVKLEVPAKRKRWRTWGRTRRVTQAGKWTARVVDESGKELGRASFEVEAP